MANINEYYVRPINGSDVSGQGTSHATAYQTLNFAVNDINAVHGLALNSYPDRINICSEGTANITSNIILYPNIQTLTYSGYNSVAGDGGRAALYMGVGGSAFQFSARAYANFVNLDITGGTNPLNISNGCAINCTVSNTHSGGIVLGGGTKVIGCSAWNINNFFIYSSNTCYISGCKFYANGVSMTSTPVQLGASSVMSFCTLDVGPTGQSAILVNSSNSVIHNNSIYSSGNGWYGINVSGTRSIVHSNIIQGFRGQPYNIFGYAIYNGNASYDALFAANNSFFDCNVGIYTGGSRDFIIQDNNETLVSEPFADVTNGDWTPNDIGNLRGGAYSAWAASNLCRGAWQVPAGGAGGGLFRVNLNGGI